ncbi:type IV pilus modification protein PilV [Hydrogenophaga taeniospiralis]|nr:type IV pilus modification protein PilV [Hydrogenophaga taeniospiralis]
MSDSVKDLCRGRHVPPPKNGPPRSSQRGFAMLETLVAVLVLAVGLLGMAGLQLNTIKTTRSSEFRSQAVMLSYAILDAMRADRAGALGGAYNTATSNTLPLKAVCSAAGITATTLADNTKKSWVGRLRSTMGDRDSTCGAVFCHADGECTIQIKWDDTLAGGLGAQTVTTRSRL